MRRSRRFSLFVVASFLVGAAIPLHCYLRGAWTAAASGNRATAVVLFRLDDCVNDELAFEYLNSLHRSRKVRVTGVIVPGGAADHHGSLRELAEFPVRRGRCWSRAYARFVRSEGVILTPTTLVFDRLGKLVATVRADEPLHLSALEALMRD